MTMAEGDHAGQIGKKEKLSVRGAPRPVDDQPTESRRKKLDYNSFERESKNEEGDQILFMR